MSCLGLHLSLDEEQVSALKATPEDQRVEYVQEELEDRLWSSEPSRGQETDKAWDAIHRALTDGRLGYDNGEYPLSHAVLGGEPLYSGDDYVMSLKTPAQVRAVAAALDAVTKDVLRAGYDAIEQASYQASSGRTISSTPGTGSESSSRSTEGLRPKGVGCSSPRTSKRALRSGMSVVSTIYRRFRTWLDPLSACSHSPAAGG